MICIWDNNNIIITSYIKKIPHIDGVFLSKIFQEILSKKYNLSINFVGKKRILDINIKYRNKNYVTDILSFPLDNDNGEIFINLDKVYTKSKEFNITFQNYLNYLYIHSAIHLLGYDHGEDMDKLEKKYCKKLNIPYIY